MNNLLCHIYHGNRIRHSKRKFIGATNKIRTTQTLLVVLHLISSLQNPTDALIMVTLYFCDGICFNIKCFLNEHEAKSFTADWLLITINSSDMARVCPRSQGALLSLKRHQRPSLFITKVFHSGRWCHDDMRGCSYRNAVGIWDRSSAGERSPLLERAVHHRAMGQRFRALSYGYSDQNNSCEER